MRPQTASSGSARTAASLRGSRATATRTSPSLSRRRRTPGSTITRKISSSRAGPSPRLPPHHPPKRRRRMSASPVPPSPSASRKAPGPAAERGDRAAGPASARCASGETIPSRGSASRAGRSRTGRREDEAGPGRAAGRPRRSGPAAALCRRVGDPAPRVVGDRGGVEELAVLELDPAAQPEGPDAVVARGLPAEGQAAAGSPGHTAGRWRRRAARRAGARAAARRRSARAAGRGIPPGGGDRVGQLSPAAGSQALREQNLAPPSPPHPASSAASRPAATSPRTRRATGLRS